MEALPLEVALSAFSLPKEDIIPNANCHGFTFACSAYWIQNDSVDFLLRSDGWEEVGISKATIAVFRNNGNVVHSCKIVPADGNIKFVGKAGIGAVKYTCEEGAAARGNSYNSISFYRKTRC